MQFVLYEICWKLSGLFNEYEWRKCEVGDVISCQLGRPIFRGLPTETPLTKQEQILHN
jgi:hypothetical protein